MQHRTGILKRFVLSAALLAMATWVSAEYFETVPQKICGRSLRAVQCRESRARLSLDDYYASTTSVAIPDFPGDTAISVINVQDDVLITDLNVFVDIRHTWMRDLRVSLTFSGDSGEVLLMDMLPLDSAVNLNGVFDDEAGISIVEAVTPLTGYWRPLQALNHYDGFSALGDWTLRVYDRFRLDSGYVAGWGLSVNPVVNLSGTVRNSMTQAPVRGAIVRVGELSLTARTGSSGLFEFTGLNAGTYTILFTKTDYETLTVAGVGISAAEPLALDTVMQTLPGFYEFASTFRALDIPDGQDSVAATLTVNENIVITDLDVTVNIEHTYTGDLDLYLVSPRDEVVRLAPMGTGGYGVGFVDCRFDDEAGLAIASGSNPFTGRYRPFVPLTQFDGDSTAGVWQLRVADRLPDDSGTIQNFTLHVQGEPAAIDHRGNPAWRDFEFYGCYPNPFNSITEFRFTMSRPERVRLTVFDVLGREVRTIADNAFTAGEHRIAFLAGDLPSGLYIARLTFGRISQFRKLVLLK